MILMIAREVHKADNLSPAVQVRRPAQAAAERTEVQNSALLPQEWVLGGNTGCSIHGGICIGHTHDLASIIDQGGRSIGATQGAEIHHHAALPQECPLLSSELT